MAEIIRPISEEVDAPTVVGSAITVSDAALVRATNTSTTTAHLVTLTDAAGTTIGTMTLGANRDMFINKNKDEKLFAANTEIKFARVTSKG